MESSQEQLRDTLTLKRRQLAEIKSSRALGPVTDTLVEDLQDEIAALESELDCIRG